MKFRQWLAGWLYAIGCWSIDVSRTLEGHALEACICERCGPGLDGFEPGCIYRHCAACGS